MDQKSKINQKGIDLLRENLTAASEQIIRLNLELKE